MPCNVTFCKHNREGRCVPEEELARNIGDLRATLVGGAKLYGAILIDAPLQPTVAVDDELWAIVLNLCFRSVPDLVAGRPFELRYYRYAGTLRLEPVEAALVIAGDFVATVRLPRDAVLRALYHCGERFIALLKQLDPATWGDTSVLLETAALPAAESLRQIP
jgi:hypothetical protein